ncbi:hypothetical protein HNY73_005508 [Argiope bruennichi]|uniref:Uncharacterized protein n=1 Tax=Argiope bruennichi TaxID=94029 RepID=A0A8T0FJ50_ARGBR|nr:hypothetical protein HNY73_005508 [Argiope bruennichi]
MNNLSPKFSCASDYSSSSKHSLKKLKELKTVGHYLLKKAGKLVLNNEFKQAKWTKMVWKMDQTKGFHRASRNQSKKLPLEMRTASGV